MLLLLRSLDYRGRHGHGWHGLHGRCDHERRPLLDELRPGRGDIRMLLLQMRLHELVLRGRVYWPRRGLLLLVDVMLLVLMLMMHWLVLVLWVDGWAVLLLLLVHGLGLLAWIHHARARRATHAGWLAII